LVREHKIAELNLVLVGTKGWQYDKIFQQAGELVGLSHRIIFTGFIPDEDLVPLYSGAMGFVYMSLYEGFGLPVLESMQCGTPVITSNNSSLPEVVGGAGIMLDAKDEDGLCHAMYQLYSNKSLREMLRTRALERAKQFSWTRCARETLAGYRKAMELAMS